VTGSSGFVVDGRITRLWLVLNPEKLGDDGG
jgi:hypothetical protein